MPHYTHNTLAITLTGLLAGVFLTGLPVLQPYWCTWANPLSESPESTGQSVEDLAKDLTFRVEPLKLSYSPRESLRTAFIIKARKPTNLCLEADPLTQIVPEITHLGKGTLPLAPMLSVDQRELRNQKRTVITLKPGQTYIHRLNLKRFPLADGETWAPGEYSISASFYLCDPDTVQIDTSAAHETVIESENRGRFLILY